MRIVLLFKLNSNQIIFWQLEMNYRQIWHRLKCKCDCCCKFGNTTFGAKDFNHASLTRMRPIPRLGNMVAVMANEQQQFESLISQLMSPDNAIRNQAEVIKIGFFIVFCLKCFP